LTVCVWPMRCERSMACASTADSTTVVKHYVAGGGEIQTGARARRLQQEDARSRVFWNAFTTSCRSSSARRICVLILCATHSFSSKCSICTNCEKTRLLASRMSESSNSNSVSSAARRNRSPQLRMAAHLAQSRERGQHVHLLLLRPCSATACMIWSRLRRNSAGKVSAARRPAAIAALLDAVGRSLATCFFQPAQQQRAQLGPKAFARDSLGGLRLSPRASLAATFLLGPDPRLVLSMNCPGCEVARLG